jgi:hypothetical protein
MKLSAFHSGQVSYVRADRASRSYNVKSMDRCSNIFLMHSVDMEMKPSFHWHAGAVQFPHKGG